MELKTYLYRRSMNSYYFHIKLRRPKEYCGERILREKEIMK